ncbi:MAG: hypothetical protein II739_07020, partial [Clostridia bacterium]|nr:hypothetical protein [Clostridia bacterium]
LLERNFEGYSRSEIPVKIWKSTVISAAPGLQKNGPKAKNLSNSSDFFSVKPLANPHKIR